MQASHAPGLFSTSSPMIGHLQQSIYVGQILRPPGLSLEDAHVLFLTPTVVKLPMPFSQAELMGVIMFDFTHVVE
jgi:hypothetical protein